MIKPERIQKLNDLEPVPGPVVYWMSRDMRTRDNWALLYAQELAREYKQPLIVVYNLVPNYLGGRERQLTFKVDALQELEVDFAKKDIPFFVLIDVSGRQTPKLLQEFCNDQKAGALITDVSPLRIAREWTDEVVKKLSIPCYQVDAHNIIPIWITSEKREYAARTIRPKIHKLLDEYLEPFPALKKQNIKYTGKKTDTAWKKILEKKDRVVLEQFPGGELAAQKALKQFLKYLDRYGDERNDPNADAQSDLSPYLHYGQLSAARVATAVAERVNRDVVRLIAADRNIAKKRHDQPSSIAESAGAFLEELIVRRELSDNFCWYEPNYDNTACFPDWARESHAKHKKDKREYLYSYKEFEQAKTHDPLWNAAQNEMMRSGKMHGYLRMYWAKKILEWTKDAEQAMEFAIKLNDQYELDGRDPNGYAGVAWSIGGVHDRPWFERDIFGTIRYMSYDGCTRKFDTERYIETWKGTDGKNQRLFK